MLHQFLQTNKKKTLDLIEKKTFDLVGGNTFSVPLKEGAATFLNQIIEILKNRAETSSSSVKIDPSGEVAGMARIQGKEFLKSGYTVSHLVLAYGAICQAITQLATEEDLNIRPDEFRQLNMCLDVAIANAVTEYQTFSFKKIKDQEVESLGYLAHELRNALNSINISLQLIKSGQVGFFGATGQILEQNLKRMNDLIDRSLTQVRLRMEPEIHVESVCVFQVVDQILVTALVEARERKQTICIKVDAALKVEVDESLFHSALSNLIQNALKYSHIGSQIQVRGFLDSGNVIIEVEDECGGLKNENVDLFKPFEQQNENKKGLGLGLTIAQKAMGLNHGKITVQNIPGKGCVFRMTLPHLVAK